MGSFSDRVSGLVNLRSAPLNRQECLECATLRDEQDAWRIDDSATDTPGESVDVMVPSNRLRIVKPFEVGADEELSFVFDVTVIQKGPAGGYNLLSVIGKSDVTGDEVEVDEVDTEGNVTA